MFLEKKLSQTQNQSIKNIKACKHNYKCLYFQAEYKARVLYKLKYISYLSVGAVVVAQVVVHQSTDREVPGSIPAAAGSWTFLSLFSILYFNQWWVRNQVPRWGAPLLVFYFQRK